jgi:hypothetical protein
MYAKCSSIEYAHKVFKRETKHDLILWSAMLTGYAQANFGEEVLALMTCWSWESMQQSVLTMRSLLTMVKGQKRE